MNPHDKPTHELLAEKKAQYDADKREKLDSLGEPVRATIIGFDIPFMNLVGFLVKVALASIPAAMIVSFAYYTFISVFIKQF